jgi:hypothetical protein
MKIYVQLKNSFYFFPEIMWDTIKLRPYNYIDKGANADNPQFAPGDRVWFEDLKYWTEVVVQDGCTNCACMDSSVCIEGQCSQYDRADKTSVIFRKLDETLEPEKSPNPQPTVILDNDRDRMAWEMFKLITAESIADETLVLDLAFKSTDAFIARAKQEESK